MFADDAGFGHQNRGSPNAELEPMTAPAVRENRAGGWRRETLFAMSAHREQAQIEAPVQAVWRLVGDPSRYPEWWPRVIEVRGERFEQGDEYAQVTKDPQGKVKSSFLIEEARDLREIRMSCQLTGTYAHWLLTPAQGGTFVELNMGMEPKGFGYRLFDLTLGKWWFRSWSQQSLDSLRDAARDDPANPE
jgi:hypothetical protein